MKLEFIAEIGWNFMGNMELAERMILEAKNSGATHVKFQYWKPSKLKDGPWMSDGRIEIYQKAALNLDGVSVLQKICQKIGINFLISTFDVSDAQELAQLGVSEIKVPSHEIYNLPLHEICSEHFKRIFLSCGAGSWSEIVSAIEAYSRRDTDFVAMHCVSSYPCPAADINLPKLKLLRKQAKTLGFSDHSESYAIPASSVLYGVSVIEKHFTIDNSLPGRDNKFALLPATFKKMVDAANDIAAANIDHGIDALEREADTIENYRGRWSAGR